MAANDLRLAAIDPNLIHWEDDFPQLSECSMRLSFVTSRRLSKSEQAMLPAFVAQMTDLRQDQVVATATPNRFDIYGLTLEHLPSLIPNLNLALQGAAEEGANIDRENAAFEERLQDTIAEINRSLVD